ncbi:MAG: hypothetical protein WCO25_01295 [Candidatus Uhrbacteria bacterium]
MFQLAQLKKYERGESFDLPALRIQNDAIRIREALGHKAEEYSIDTQKTLQLLINFGIFPWTNTNIHEMMHKTIKIRHSFRSVYCISAARGICIQLW